MKRKDIDEYISSHPHSKVKAFFDQIHSILSFQRQIPSSIDVYDVECNHRISKEPMYPLRTFYQQILTVKFRYKGDYVLCHQDMWFHDPEFKNVVIGSQTYSQLLSINFTENGEEEDQELDDISNNDKLVLFQWLHGFLLARFQYDPFYMHYDKIKSVYQKHVKDFHEWLDRKYCELIGHLVCKSILLQIQSFLF
jgi:hypothetical protein